MSHPNLPISCSLTDAEFRQRRTEILNSFQGSVLEVKELENGFAYQFPATANFIERLAQLIVVERECCPFLQFKLQLEPANGPLWLELTGPEGTKDFLKSIFAG